MKALKSKLLLSITTLVVAIVAVAGSAYAWFTLSNTANASMQLTVTSGDGLQISSSLNGTYAATLPLITGPTIGAATTQNGTSFQKIAVSGQTYSMAAAAAGSDYYETTLYFRTPTKPTAAATNYLQLDNANSSISDTYTTAPVRVQNAVRVSFTNSASTKIWEPNTGLGTYGDNNSGTPEVENAGWEYFVGVAGEANVTAVETYLTSNPTQTTNANLNQLSDVYGWVAGEGTNIGYYTASVVVRIWLEGFDADTYDAIFSQVFNVALSFKK